MVERITTTYTDTESFRTILENALESANEGQELASLINAVGNGDSYGKPMGIDEFVSSGEARAADIVAERIYMNARFPASSTKELDAFETEEITVIVSKLDTLMQEFSDFIHGRDMYWNVPFPEIRIDTAEIGEVTMRHDPKTGWLRILTPHPAYNGATVQEFRKDIDNRGFSAPVVTFTLQLRGGQMAYIHGRVIEELH